MCERPYFRGAEEWACRKCLPCSVNRTREWALRMVLEATQHRSAFFITLTYNNEHLPADGSVSRRALQLFFKRFRKAISPERLRFYAIGEYGLRGGRPHYHAAVFTSVDASVVAAALDQAWRDKAGEKMGFVHLGALTAESAAYVASYMAIEKRKDGRAAEFATMSLRPYGIGGGATAQIVRASRPHLVDAPTALRFGGRLLPLGRYLRNRIGVGMGLVKHWNPRLRPLDVGLLVRQLELLEKDGRTRREARRAMSARLAKDRFRRSLQRRVF